MGRASAHNQGRRAAGVVAFAAAMGLPCLASGAEPTERLEVALDYSAPPSCPSASEFWLAVQTRSHRVERVATEITDVVVRVQIREVGSKSRGELQIVRAGTPTDARTVTASACADVMDALALTTVLGLDPEAVLGAQEPDDTTAESVAAPPTTTSTASTSREASASDTQAADSRGNADDEEYPNEHTTFIGSSASSSGSIGLALGANFVFTYPIQQGPNVGAEVYASLVPQHVRFTSPRVDFAVSATDNEPVGDSSLMKFTLLTGELRACPIEAAPVSFVRFRPCVSFQAGSVEVSGRNLTVPRTTQDLWLSLGVATQLAFFFTDHMYAQISAAAQFTLTPQQYSIEVPPVVLGETAVLNPWIAVGLGYEFR